jgi:UDP-N-acetylmuramate--alanine ligase
MNYFVERGFQSKKRAEVLGIITKTLFVCSCRNTWKDHNLKYFGHILYESGADAFIGGIVENYNSNLIGDGKTVTVVEAEMNLIVLFAFASQYCITSMDADLDIYGTSDIGGIILEFADKVEDKAIVYNKTFRCWCYGGCR